MQSPALLLTILPFHKKYIQNELMIPANSGQDIYRKIRMAQSRKTSQQNIFLRRR